MNRPKIQKYMNEFYISIPKYPTRTGTRTPIPSLTNDGLFSSQALSSLEIISLSLDPILGQNFDFLGNSMPFSREFIEFP